MNIQLISTDRNLRDCCREVLAEICPTCTFSSVSSQEAPVEADFSIWDMGPDVTLPENLELNSPRHLLLIDRRDYLDFLESHRGAVHASILLKPVSAAVMAIFLGGAVSMRDVKDSLSDTDIFLRWLMHTNLRFQEYNLDRSSFLARAAHDFRAPLTALSGYCTLLLSDPSGTLDDHRQEMLRTMRNSARRLSRMTSAMFELCSNTHIKRMPELKPGDIREALEQALNETALFANEKSISITRKIDPCDGPLHFDTTQIEQVFVNILENACKYTPNFGSIEVRGYPFFWERRSARTGSTITVERRRSAAREPNGYRVDIGDSGARIPEEHLRSIFEGHTLSLLDERSRSSGGLGLAICKTFVTEHEGRVWAENRDSGTVFSVVLPMRRSESTSSGEGAE